MIRMMRSTLAIGEFDGFHVGHRHLLAAARSLADARREPLVAVILEDESIGDRLSERDDRVAEVVRAGASAAMVLRVDTEHDAAAGRLIDLLVHVVPPSTVVMACLPEQNVAMRYPALRTELARSGIELVQVERSRADDGIPVTTAGICRALVRGDISRATKMLGHPYALSGTVVRGAKLGRTIGFPTANVEPPIGRVLPSGGVYAATVVCDGRRFAAAVNIGRRPTVEGNGRLLIEAHLLEFDGDLYDSRISIEFNRRLRSEQQFDGLDALVAQLRRDIENVRDRPSEDPVVPDVENNFAPPI